MDKEALLRDVANQPVKGRLYLPLWQRVADKLADGTWRSGDEVADAMPGASPYDVFRLMLTVSRDEADFFTPFIRAERRLFQVLPESDDYDGTYYFRFTRVMDPSPPGDSPAEQA